ncbi:MAG: hypothetical protein ACP5N2_01940 [Candidatus Nanoarchaeia archaeon]
MEQTNKREEQVKLMRECIDDARTIVQEKRLLESQEVLASIATALFVARVKEQKISEKEKVMETK